MRLLSCYNKFIENGIEHRLIMVSALFMNDLGSYFPLKLPLRFSKNAATPSALSSVVQARAWR
jgi:hypothetical protein